MIWFFHFRMQNSQRVQNQLTTRASDAGIDDRINKVKVIRNRGRENAEKGNREGMRRMFVLIDVRMMLRLMTFL